MRITAGCSSLSPQRPSLTCLPCFALHTRSRMAANNPNLPNPNDLQAVWRFLEDVRVSTLSHAQCWRRAPRWLADAAVRPCCSAGAQGTNTIMTKLKDGMSYSKYMELYTYVERGAPALALAATLCARADADTPDASVRPFVGRQCTEQRRLQLLHVEQDVPHGRHWTAKWV